MPSVNINPNNAKKFCKVVKKGVFICLYHWKDCGHCITLLPIWKDAVKKSGKNSYIVEIELANLKHLDKKYRDVQGFPSIIVYKNGKKFKEFSEQRTLENLEKFIKENKDPRLH